MNGIDAKWEYGGHVVTTDMVPEQYMTMEFPEIEKHLQREAIETKIKLVTGKFGSYFAEESVISNEQYYDLFAERYSQDKLDQQNQDKNASL